MNKDELLKIMEIFKLLKSSYVVSYGNTIIGCDKNFVYLKKIELEYSLPTLALDMLEVGKQLKEDDSTPYLKDPYIFNEIMTKLNTISNISSLAVKEFINIQDDIDFSEANNLKTTQGIKYIQRDNRHMVPIYNGLLPTVKGDKVDLFIYELVKYDIYTNMTELQSLCKFIIHKKKKINMEVYLLCRDMR